MSDPIFHIVSKASWPAAQKTGVYIADSLASEGFVHCSKADQVLRVADMLFAGQHDLLLLVIDPACLTSELRWDPGVDLETELFPHVYGPINMDAVIRVLDFVPGADGKFRLPESLELVHGR